MDITSILESGSTIAELPFVLSKEEQKSIDEKVNSSLYEYFQYQGKYYIANSEAIRQEKEIARWIVERLYSRIQCGYPDEVIMALIKKYEEQEGITLAPEQVDGVKVLLNNHIAILTGGPGTGKTSVLKCVLYCIQALETDDKDSILCLSPTGKAASRMTEATGYNAQTILSVIKYNPATKRHRDISEKYIIVDEWSMADIETTYMLLKALRYNAEARIYLIGDTQQLPSVGYGAVLRDMLTSEIIPYNSLIKTFRQKEGSVLLDNIETIKKGCYYPLKEGNDFEKHESLHDFLPTYFNTIKDVGQENVVVLTPNRKVGLNCSENLNRIIQAKLNKRPGYEAEILRDGEKKKISFRVGDPVIQLENCEIANGDIGTVIFTDNQKVVVRFTADRKKTYTASTISQLDLAYAISIHKSQGSEYPVAFVLCDKSRLLDRNMIYTAVTRAKKKCILFGSESYISSACKIENTWNRLTTLDKYLEEENIMRKIRIDSFVS